MFLSVFDDFKNSIDFFIRQSTKFSRKNFSLSPENVDDLFENEAEAAQREEELGIKYDLALLKKETTKQNYAQNMYTLDVLDKYFPAENHKNLKMLDIGAKNWFYAKGEYAFFKKYGENLKMTGVELDAHRLYSNFYSRYEVAKFHIKDIAQAQYIAGDFLNIKDKYDYIVWILPFVKKVPHTKWGLPSKYFKPQELLAHAYNSLNAGGKMFIVNQGEEEYCAQKELLDNMGIEYLPIGEIESLFLKYGYKRYAAIVSN